MSDVEEQIEWDALTDADRMTMDQLNCDAIDVVAEALGDDALVAVALSSTCHSLRACMAAPLYKLRQSIRLFGHNCNACEAKAAELKSREDSLADCCAIGQLARSNSLQKLEHLCADNNHSIGTDHMRVMLLAPLPSLTKLSLLCSEIGDKGAAELAKALSEHALPVLKKLLLSENSIGNDGLAALAAPLRALPQLELLCLNRNNVGAAGLRHLLHAEPQGALAALKTLELHGNPLLDEGCAVVASALRGGVAPSLDWIYLGRNHASAAAVTELREQLYSAIRARRTNQWLEGVAAAL